jgi:P27 family predicted phage terminase small subunit
MSKTGRPSLPIRIKELQGTFREDRKKNPIEFAPITECPKPEVWLENRAKKYFKNICKLLIDKHLLNEANVPLVLMMAQEFATYEEATRELKTGKVKISGRNDYEQLSPWVTIRNQAQKNYRDLSSLFGLDPISVGKIGNTAKPASDPFEEMQKKYRD